jgi:N-acetylmuramoyl-L-alanine amidase
MAGVRVGLLAVLALVGASHVQSVRAAGILYEKATALDESLALAQRLRDAGFHVRLTRTNDKTVSLRDRTNAAEGADVMVSVHNNANPSRTVKGTEAYYQIGNAFGGDLASRIVRAISARAGTTARGAFTRKGDNGDYYFVLRETRTTSIIVEGAFLSNPDEARQLADPAFRDRMVDGIASALIDRLVVQYAPQGAGPPAGGVLPAPVIDAVYAGEHNVELSWTPALPFAAYEIWRDGNIIGKVTDSRFTDVGIGPGHHLYAVVAVVETAGLVERSQPAVGDAVVPWSVVIDAGHGGNDNGAAGKY